MAAIEAELRPELQLRCGPAVIARTEDPEVLAVFRRVVLRETADTRHLLEALIPNEADDGND
jgi:hypothetical protein